MKDAGKTSIGRGSPCPPLLSAFPTWQQIEASRCGGALQRGSLQSAGRQEAGTNSQRYGAPGKFCDFANQSLLKLPERPQSAQRQKNRRSDRQPGAIHGAAGVNHAPQLHQRRRVAAASLCAVQKATAFARPPQENNMGSFVAHTHDLPKLGRD